MSDSLNDSMILRTSQGVRVRFQIIPQSSKTMLVGPHNGAIKVKIAAPPVDGAANEELIYFLKKILNIPKQNIQIVQGHTSKIKIIEIVGIDLDTAMNKFIF